MSPSIHLDRRAVMPMPPAWLCCPRRHDTLAVTVFAPCLHRVAAAAYRGYWAQSVDDLTRGPTKWGRFMDVNAGVDAAAFEARRIRV